MNTKKETAIVFGATKNFAFAIASVLMDLKKFDYSWITEVVIFHDGISNNQQKLLNRILPCVFVKYNFPIKDKSNFDQNILNYFSEMVFSKFECLRLLDTYKNVIWLDYDIIITKDISELASQASFGIKIMLGGGDVLSQLSRPVVSYDMNAGGVSAATFVFQDNIGNYMKMYNFCYEKTEQYAEYLYQPEQAIFDFMIQDFNLHPEFLDWDIYCVHPEKRDKYKDAKILHSYGARKFWNEINNEDWNLNYKNWLKMGGHGYSLKKYLIIKKVKNILSSIGVYKDIKKTILKLKGYFIK